MQCIHNTGTSLGKLGTFARASLRQEDETWQEKEDYYQCEPHGAEICNQVICFVANPLEFKISLLRLWRVQRHLQEWVNPGQDFERDYSNQAFDDIERDFWEFNLEQWHVDKHLEAIDHTPDLRHGAREGNIYYERDYSDCASRGRCRLSN